ncbi:hypothetical protein NIES4102_44260 (plasmid) [Chondrocystis sp. NIES-4102]|nr:hypothetical protein NIES4102_44260 [Chondrocystis sp. NIES-4102]
MSRCKVCQSKLLSDLDRQIKAGANFNYLVGWCSDRGFKVTANTLKRHALKHIAGYKQLEVTKEKLIDHQPKVIKQKQVDHQPTITEINNPNIISFEAYCQSIGLQPNHFQDLEQNFDKIIYGSQKALSLLFFKGTAIVDFKLTQHLYGQSAYPLQQIKGLRSIFEMYAKVTGIEAVIDENVAIKILESMGYSINKSIIDIK